MRNVQLFLYTVLTLLITLLAMLRHKVGNSIGWELRIDRDERNLIPNLWFSKGNKISLFCCDCGLAHRLFESERGSHAWPQRPTGFGYKWRLDHRWVKRGKQVVR